MPRTLTARLALFIAVLINQPRHARGQAPEAHRLLLGCVVSAGGGGIVGAHVWLDGRPDTLTTDAAGQFAFRDVGEGRHTVRLRHLGFRPAAFDVVIHRDDAMCRPFPMTPLPPGELAAVRVTGRLDQTNLRGFYARLDSRIYPVQAFLTAEQARDVAASQTSDLIRVMGGVRVVSSGRRGEAVTHQVRVRGGLGGARDCVPFVYVDGLLYDQQGRVDDIPPGAVAAVEVHGGLARTPMEFQRGNNQCGVVLIWTRTR